MHVGFVSAVACHRQVDGANLGGTGETFIFLQRFVQRFTFGGRRSSKFLTTTPRPIALAWPLIGLCPRMKSQRFTT
jgi:hypothetical protein